ncbi:MAG: TIGR04283 family arsenosugar biosynthesis glycosyltransferase [Syntrophomonas sp.]
MPEPLPVSVIIPTLNEEKCIAKLLQSLGRIDNIEIIVSDGGSEDKTASICANYPVIFIKTSPGRGPQLNAGAAAATREILFFIHADSEIEPGLINDICRTVEAGRQWGCCSLEFDNKAVIFRLIAWFSNLRARLFSSCYGDQGIYCCHDLFHEVGAYPGTAFLEDIALSDCLRRSSRAGVLKSHITSSSRRFKQQGILRTLVKMQVVKIMYRLGVKPESLVKWYRPGRGDKL